MDWDHLTIFEPIVVARGMECSEWPGLDHMLTLGSRDGVTFTTSGLSWVRSGFQKIGFTVGESMGGSKRNILNTCSLTQCLTGAVCLVESKELNSAPVCPSVEMDSLSSTSRWALNKTKNERKVFLAFHRNLGEGMTFFYNLYKRYPYQSCLAFKGKRIPEEMWIA